MRTIDKVKIAQGYIEGMLWAAFGVRIFSENVAEWQIEAVKKYAKKLKEEEIEHSEITHAEKDGDGGVVSPSYRLC